MPISDSLLQTPNSTRIRETMRAVKLKQAAFYIMSAKERPSLNVVSSQMIGDDWQKSSISKVLPYRSYEVRLQDGTTRRRTSKHVCFSKASSNCYRAGYGRTSSGTSAACRRARTDNPSTKFSTIRRHKIWTDNQDSCSIQRLIWIGGCDDIHLYIYSVTPSHRFTPY